MKPVHSLVGVVPPVVAVSRCTGAVVLNISTCLPLIGWRSISPETVRRVYVRRQ